MTAVRRFTAVVCLLGAISLAAQTPTPTPKVVPVQTEPVTAQVRADTDRDLSDPSALKLSLDDALQTAVQNNVGIQLERYVLLESGQSLRGQYGIFDWFTTADIERQSSQSPTTSQFAPSGSRATIANFGVSQFIPTGGTYSIGFNNSRGTTTGGGTFVNPAYRSSLGLGLTHPLMRNFGVDISRRGILIARNTLGINRDVFRGALMDTAVATEQVYLDLVYARRFVDVVKESLFLARDQARITQIRIDVGASAPLDILQPRVQIATQEENLIAAVASVRDAEDRLRAVMHLDPAEWSRPIIPTSPVGYTPIAINPEQAVATALQLRPELHQQQLTTATRKVQYTYARNQVLPQLDLKLNYNSAGLAGRTQEFDPVTGLPTGRFNTTGYSNALSQVFGNDFPSWIVAVNVGLPLTNIGARAEAKRAELDVALARTNEEQTRQNIALEVRKTARDIDTTAKEITASRAAREAAAQNLEAERRRYENGMTTNFQVLQIQQQLSDSRAREILALVAYNKSVAAYHRAVGDLLDVANIKVEEPKIEEPNTFRVFDRYNWLNYGSRIQSNTTETKQ
ncbi:MAG TPA: TolC family protein [Thermoanaerobaculia bacterium]|nr:TolC family protein [Thermoanaerobaculia bacterium]